MESLRYTSFCLGCKEVLVTNVDQLTLLSAELAHHRDSFTTTGFGNPAGVHHCRNMHIYLGENVDGNSCVGQDLFAEGKFSFSERFDMRHKDYKAESRVKLL